jgi:Mg-chelatase subunit ChlD
VTTWIRRSFDAPGLTQYPTGRHLDAVQSQFGGSVVLCLDVSGSMRGSPLSQAVQGCRRFVDEALQASYEVAVLFWDHGVVGCTALTREQRTVHAFLDRASIHGGTNVVPALHRAHALLAGQKGDRVVAIFGDGDLGDAAGARRKSDAMRVENIRIITCGLGLASAQSLDVISTESSDTGPRVADADDIADSIAGMAGGLRRTPRR